MEKRKRIVDLLIAVRHTNNDIQKVADEICSLINNKEVNTKEQTNKLCQCKDKSTKHFLSNYCEDCKKKYSLKITI